MKGFGPLQQRQLKLERKTRLLECHKFKQLREPMTCGMCAEIMKIDKLSTAHQILCEMVKDMELARIGTPGKYKYCPPSPRWLSKPWRTITNRKIGITEPLQIGCCV